MESIEEIGIVLGALSILICAILFLIATCRHGFSWFLFFWFFQPIGALFFILKYQEDSKKPLLCLLVAAICMSPTVIHQLNPSAQEQQLAKQRLDDSEKIGAIIERELESQKIEELKEFNKIRVTPNSVLIAFFLNSENANNIKLAKRLARIAVISPEVVQKNNVIVVLMPKSSTGEINTGLMYFGLSRSNSVQIDDIYIFRFTADELLKEPANELLNEVKPT